MRIRAAVLVAALAVPVAGLWALSVQPAIAERPPQKPETSTEAQRPASRPDPARAPAQIDSAAPTGKPAEIPEAAAKPPNDAVEADDAAPEDQGPPVHQTMRESDFDYAACLLALHDLGTEYEELPAIADSDQRDCGIARPIRVTQILPGVALAGGADMRCDNARALGFWLRDFVRPAASRLPGSPRLSGLQLGTTYDCRGRIGTDGKTKLSEHAFGNAIDIAAFTFHDAEPIPVTPRQDTGDLIEAFQRAARGAACLYFTTVLGPGSNAAHDDHLHLDIAARNRGWRLCQ